MRGSGLHRAIRKIDRLLTGPTGRRAGAFSIDSQRAEIQRLIAKLDETRKALGPGSAVVDERLQSALEQSIGAGEARPALRLPLPRRSDAHQGRDGAGSPRLSQYRRELGEIKRLRKQIESSGPLEHPGSFEALEKRLSDLEKGMKSTAGASASSTAAGPPAPGQNYTFSGIIQGDLLSDMLQLASSNAMTGVFVVENADAKHVLHFDEGQICHAEGSGLSGEAAFFAAFALGSGRYYFSEASEPPDERTITANTQFLILEALRQIDESDAG